MKRKIKQQRRILSFTEMDISIRQNIMCLRQTILTFIYQGNENRLKLWHAWKQKMRTELIL